MATVYDVTIGSKSRGNDGTDDNWEYFDFELGLTLIDGAAETDRWVGHRIKYNWPTSGKWFVRSSTKELYLLDDTEAQVLAKFHLKSWPMRRYDEGDVTLTKPINGKIKHLYLVNKIE